MQIVEQERQGMSTVTLIAHELKLKANNARVFEL